MSADQVFLQHSRSEGKCKGEKFCTPVSLSYFNALSNTCVLFRSGQLWSLQAPLFGCGLD